MDSLPASPRAMFAALPGALAAWTMLTAGYWLLRQDAFHGLDAYLLLPGIDTGYTKHPQHLLYMHMACAVREWLRPFGGGAVDAMHLLAAAATAFGVVSTYLAWRRIGNTRGRAALVAATVAAMPGVLHFATVAELNALTFGSGAAAFLALVTALTGRASARLWRRTLSVGAITALGAGMHSIGHLTAPVCAMCVIAWPGSWSVRARADAVVALMIAHALVFVMTAAVAGALSIYAPQDSAAGSDLLAGFGNTGHILVYEWLYPFAPTSVLWLLALRGGALTARLAWCGTIAIGGYLLVDVALLGPMVASGPFLPSGMFAEYGAYALAIAPWLAGLALCRLRLPAAAAACALTIALGGAHWCRHRGTPPTPALQAALAAAALDPSVLLLAADHDELAVIVRAAPAAEYQSVPNFAFLAFANRVTDPAHVTAWFDLQFRTWIRRGKRVLLSPHVLAALRTNPVIAVRTLADWLPAQYELRAGGDGPLVVLLAR